MRRLVSWAALAGVAATSACAIPQTAAPRVAAMPGEGRTFEQFQSDDQRCRQAAAAANGFVTPKQAADQGAQQAVLFGTGAGIAGGAMIGSSMAAVGAGAILGGGAGIVAGSLLAAGVAESASQGNQHHYDVTYVQCMAAAGERVPDLLAAAGSGVMTGGGPVAAAPQSYAPQSFAPPPPPVAATPLPPPQASAQPYEPPQDEPPQQPAYPQTAYQRPAYARPGYPPPAYVQPAYAPQPAIVAYVAPLPPLRAPNFRPVYCPPGYCGPRYAYSGGPYQGWRAPTW